MKRFKHIIIKVNEQIKPELDIAVLRGIELASATGAKITLFDVVEPHETILSSYADIVSPAELTEFIVDQRLDQLTDLAQQLQSTGLEISVSVAKGKNFIEIVKAVILNKADLLIKVANESAKSFDSNDFHIMRKCPKPVWLIKEEQHDTVKKVLAAVDLSMEQHAEGRAQNRMIIDIASSLSQYKDAELTILSCWSLYGEEALRHGAFTRVSPAKIESLLKHEEREYQESLNILVNEYTQCKFEQILAKGDPKTIIPAFVNNKGIDVVVMGTIGRSGIPGFLIGNTSESVLQAINSSVITLKPENWVSPIY
jgi:universal stress protein E